MGNMPGQKRPSDANVIAMLHRYQCPMPFHAVRARFMGGIASPLDRSPVQALQELWGGELPQFATVEDSNHLLHVLMAGLWNPLTEHRIDGNPFKLTRVQVKQTRAGLHRYALLRQQEIEGFMDGLFGPHEELDLPESARDGVRILGKVRAFLTGVITLLDDPDQPAAAGDLTGLSDNLQALAIVVEKEMNTVLLSCTRARRQPLADIQPIKPIVH
jgi:hypothetical protein